MKKFLIALVLAWSVWRFWPPPDPLIFNHTLGEYIGYDAWVEACKAPVEIHHAMTRDEWDAFIKQWAGRPEGECDTPCREAGVLTCQKTYHYQPDPFTG